LDSAFIFADFEHVGEGTDMGEAQPKRVLIVEDNYWTAMYLADVFAEAGYTAIGPCHSYTAALQILADSIPQCAVIDLDLGGPADVPLGTEGERLLSILETGGAGILVHSGVTQRFELLRRYYPDCVFLSKPASPAQLLHALDGFPAAGNVGSS